MKISSVVLCFIIGLGGAYGQTNPKHGYIITNENDTITGIIDYRTDTKNANLCVFKSAEDDVFKAYGPQDIKGYRIKDNGVFYVTKTFPVDGVESTFFAEFLLRGNVSLYHYRRFGTDYFYLTDQKGKVAALRETGILYAGRVEQLAAQRQKVREVSHMFQNSQETLQKLWTTPKITSDFLIQLIKEYNQKFFPEAGPSEVFSVREHTSSVIEARLRIEAGIGINEMTIWPYSDNQPPLNITGISPIIGIGTDVRLPRFSKNLILQATVYYSYCRGSKEPDKSAVYKHRHELQFHDVGLQVGAAYSFFSEKRVSPVIRGGTSLNYFIGPKTKNMKGYYDVARYDTNKTVSIRYYAGLGAEVKMGHHKASLTGNFVMRNYGTLGIRAKMWTMNLGFIF